MIPATGWVDSNRLARKIGLGRSNRCREGEGRSHSVAGARTQPGAPSPRRPRRALRPLALRPSTSACPTAPTGWPATRWCAISARASTGRWSRRWAAPATTATAPRRAAGAGGGARNGYERTSVKQVIGRAGVSRLSFYEQFANKQGCFLATFDMIALRELRRISKAYRAADGGLEERLRAVFERIAEQAQDSRKASTLVLVEAETAGTGGTLRLRKAAATCEHLLSRSFLESPEAVPLPTPVVRGITGGLHGAMSSALRAGRLGEGPVMAQEMLRWTLLFQTPEASRMQEPMAARQKILPRGVLLGMNHQRLNQADGFDRHENRLIPADFRCVANLTEGQDVTDEGMG